MIEKLIEKGLRTKRCIENEDIVGKREKDYLREMIERVIER